MSLKNPKHLLIIGAVVVALMVGTVLLANYANILPAGSDADSQVEASPATGQTPCPAAKACPSESTKSGCAGEATTTSCPCCPKVCSSESTKPDCAGEATTGGCPMSSPPATTNTCCGGKTSTATE